MARFLISPAALERNARILRQVGDAGGARMLVALKAFACTAALKAVQPYCDGCCASGLYEARLAQSLGGEVAVFSPGYTEDELRELLNALGDEEKYGTVLRAKGIVDAEDGEWIHFDYTPGEIDIRRGAAGVTGRLCVIGAHLKESAVAELFK